MKYFLTTLTLLAVLISPVYGANTTEQDKNLEAIVELTFVKNPKMEQLFYMIATKKIGESGKNIELDSFISNLKKELQKKENFEKFAQSYSERFNAKELSEIRKIIENDVFEKYSEHSFHIIKESLQNLDQIINDLISKENGTLSAKTTSKVIEVTSENFEAEVQNSSVPVVLDFYADWCGPCQGMKVVLENLSEQLGGKIKFTKLNVDNEKDIADKFRIKDLPVVIFIKDGQIKGVHSGFADTETLNSKIEEFLL